MSAAIRHGQIRIRDTMSHHRSTPVRKLDDGTVEYLVGDSARTRDGWATLPGDLLRRVEWDQ